MQTSNVAQKDGDLNANPCESCGCPDTEETPVFMSSVIADLALCQKCEDFIANEEARKELEKIAKKEGITVEDLCRNIDQKFQNMCKEIKLEELRKKVLP